jgi:hypothetical protein
MFESNSRYANSVHKSLTADDGRIIVYIQRRMLPPLAEGEESNIILEDEIVRAGDRLDLIATRILGDPEQYWRICDINDLLHPLDLTDKPGSIIHIPISGVILRR